MANNNLNDMLVLGASLNNCSEDVYNIASTIADESIKRGLNPDDLEMIYCYVSLLIENLTVTLINQRQPKQLGLFDNGK